MIFAVKHLFEYEFRECWRGECVCDEWYDWRELDMFDDKTDG